MSMGESRRFKPPHIRQKKKTWCVPACICSILEMAASDQQKIYDEIKPKQNLIAGNEIVKYFEHKVMLAKPLLIKDLVRLEEAAEDGWRIIVLLDPNTHGHAVVYWKCDYAFVYVMDPAKDDVIRVCRGMIV